MKDMRLTLQVKLEEAIFDAFNKHTFKIMDIINVQFYSSSKDAYPSRHSLKTMNLPNKQRVKENYDELGGKLYNVRYVHEQNSKYDAALVLTLPKDEELILDDGCGTGLLLKRLDMTSVGLDLTPALLREAKKSLKAKCHLVLGDAEHLPFRDKIFDVVYAITLLQNIPDLLGCLKEIKRISKTGGRILSTALKAAFTVEVFYMLLRNAGFIKYDIIGDAGTNDWIAYTDNL